MLKACGSTHNQVWTTPKVNSVRKPWLMELCTSNIKIRIHDQLSFLHTPPELSTIPHFYHCTWLWGQRKAVGKPQATGGYLYQAFECCQLNTPPPVMSTTADSAPGFDPFRRQPHPTRDLGTQLWTWDSLSTFKPRTAGGKISEVIQLCAEEEEAITGLLRLHYQSSQEAPSAAPWGNTSLQDPGADDQQSIKRATSSPPPLCDSGPAPNSVENILPRQPMLESAAVMATSNCLVRMENGTSHLGENLPSMTQGATGSQET